VTELTSTSNRSMTGVLRPSPLIVTRIDGSMIAVAAAAVVVVLRIALLFRYRIDSDETQHLHVGWGWANGLLQYRDFFDNHMPLFHVLFAPLVAMAGERTDILVMARMAMLPLFAAAALLAYRIGSSVYPRGPAAWATAIGCLAPGFFLCSLEFRTDDLWTVCWLACIAILVCSELTLARAALAGLMLGLAAAVSAKTTLLAACLVIAAVATHLLMRDRSRPAMRVLVNAMVFALAALVPPALIALYFASRGAWRPFWYCTISHNLVASEHPRRMLLLPISLAIIVAFARGILRDDAPFAIRKRRLFLFLVSAAYGAALISIWPIIESEHWLPFYPLAAVAFIPRLRMARMAPVLLSVELLLLVQLGAPWRDNTAPSVELIAQTMRLTSPAERVVDLKGEMLFRQRATYYVFEKITKRAMSEGRLKDTIAADVLRTGAMVTIPDNDGFPRQGRAFLNRNFIRVGAIRVAGLTVPADQCFRIEVPAVYSVVVEHGNFRGLLDAMPYVHSRYLAAGIHRLEPATAAAGRTAVIWQRAAAQGFSPWKQ